jgi:hypothetical protein
MTDGQSALGQVDRHFGLPLATVGEALEAAA